MKFLKYLIHLSFVLAIAACLLVCFGNKEKAAADKDMGAFFDAALLELANEDLAFDRVKELYKELEANELQWSKEPEWDSYVGAVSQLKAYKHVVDVLTC